MRKKIILIANDTTYVYNLRDEVIEGLLSCGYEVVIAAKQLLYIDELINMGCRLIDIETNRHGKNPLSDIKLLRIYKKILREEQPDIVLTYNIKPDIYGGLACRSLKVHYLPNITGLGTAVEYPGMMQRITKKLYRSGIKSADCVFFQNDENRVFFTEHKILNKDSRVRVLPGSGVNLNRHVKMDYPDESEKTVFLFIARIMRDKGIDLFLDVAEKFHDKGNLEFHICGQCDDDRYLDIIKESEQKGYVVYHGEQSDMLPFFRMAHCIVHPSYYPEGMSNVLLEGAAHCRPLIATDRAGCRETVDDGISGFVIPVRDVAALEDAIARFLSLSYEQKREMGLAGRDKIEREFDRRIVVNEYIDEIEKILS